MGTGGNKASLFDAEGRCLASKFVPYETLYPKQGWHEQRPIDWWQAVVESTNCIFSESKFDRSAVTCCGISGQSLAVVLLDAQGALLLPTIPIWSDSRPGTQQLERFFKKVSKTHWYQTTGNGFPPSLYTVFKIMWYRDNEPDIFRRVYKVIGSKDYINFLLTGRIATDYSYASGSGVYDLLDWNYSDKLIDAAGLERTLFPNIVPSTEVLGGLTRKASEELGLLESVKVVAGGVDNSCMSLGARAYMEGRLYNSLGSSSWIAVSSGKPLLDDLTHSYVFTHVVPDMYVSSVSIFSAGSSLRWVRDVLCQDLIEQSVKQGIDVYDLMIAEAAGSPIGANYLLFNPSLAGGTSLDKSPNIRGAFIGLELGHKREDIIRATLEGIALGLRLALDELRSLTELSPELIMVGGGSRSAFWRQIFANVYQLNIIKSNIDQQTAALGAAALAAVGTGLWENFFKIDDLHHVEKVCQPEPEKAAFYESLLPVYKSTCDALAAIGDMHLKMKCNDAIRRNLF